MHLKNVISLSGFQSVSFFQKLAVVLSAVPLMAAAPAMASGSTSEAPIAAAATAPVTEVAAGGVFEKATKEDAKADPQYRSLFLSWKKLDQVGTVGAGFVSIPSQKPVANLMFTSNFGFRSDPFKGGRAMHAGVDIPGPVGTPIYATADGIVGRAQRLGGYGNYIEVEHGQGIQTRYGHLSAIHVKPNERVRRGQLIGSMGSTGRSTGSHLHYEVRLDGRAVNPLPFLQSSDYLVAMQARGDAQGTQIAMGGPEKD